MSEQHLRMQETAEKENQSETTREIDLAERETDPVLCAGLYLCGLRMIADDKHKTVEDIRKYTG